MKIPFFILIFLLLPFFMMAQPDLREALREHKNLLTQPEVEKVYEANQYKFLWLPYPLQQQNLISLLQSAAEFALDQKDYQYAFLQRIAGGKFPLTSSDSLQTDLVLTDAALHFFKELKKGNRAPSLGYDGLKYTPDVSGIEMLLIKAIAADRLFQLAVEIQPSSKEYLSLVQKYRQMLEPQRDTVRELSITSGKVSVSNLPLMIKLFRLGIIDSVNGSFTEKDLGQKIKEAQQLFNLVPDGALKPMTLSELNVPIRKRVLQITEAINYQRWLTGLKNSSIAIVNIPSASLYVYRNGNMIFDSRLVVGKKATPTPTLSSSINEVILYPYWNVPYKIATRELLPSIKKNRAYLAAHNYQVLDKNGKIMDPYSINWSALSTSYFPYTIRQSTGCDNSLGIVKFNFYNPFTVYLHDTPAKGLFLLNKRYFSHGCMRVEKPVEFGQLLLGRNRIAIDTLTIKGCLKSQAPKPVPAEEKLPLIVMYSTAWYDNHGRVVFYEDIYTRNKY